MANRREPIRRSDVRRCEKCGEDYSITYKRCPFCDERPSRRQPAAPPPSPAGGRAAPRSSSSGGRRVAGRKDGYATNRVNPIQVAGLVASLALLIAALYIVFTTIGPLLGSKPAAPGSQSRPGSSSASQSNPAVSAPGTSSSAPPAPPPAPAVESLTLDASEITLTAGGSRTLTASVLPADTPVTWTSSNEAAATVDAGGNVVNVNNDSSQVKVTITASAGDKTAECTVYCRGSSAGTSTTAPPSSGTRGVVSGAANGLRVRSGAGTNYSSIASLHNGDSVRILGDAGGGWYRITFTGVGGVTTEGYVSQSYISVG
ncbi:MAG: SH3 domain-containing protein [Lawsonibacter sp.]|nr:SH3 domain-containing protein [Lawsonibacter sp.]